MTRRNRRKEKIEPEEIFEHAMAFMTASQHLRYTWKPRDARGQAGVAIPFSVLSAFSSELLFKTLLVIETGRIPPDTHHLLVLFNRLSPKTQALIEAKWNNYATAHAHRWIEFDETFGRAVARDLRGALKVGSKTFELTRYAYEGREEFCFYLGALPEMLFKIVFELRPDWMGYVAASFDDLNIERPPELRDVVPKQRHRDPAKGYIILQHAAES
jgi:hypothetical protein